MEPNKEHLIVEKNDRRSFTTYNVRIDGGTLTAYHDPLESAFYFSFNPRFDGGSKRAHSTASLSHGGLSYSGNPKETLPPYFERIRDLPGLPQHLVEGLEKLIAEVNTLE